MARLLTVEQVCERLGLSRQTVYATCRHYEERWRAQGYSAYEPPTPLGTELPCVRIGARKLRVPEAMLERMGV